MWKLKNNLYSCGHCRFIINTDLFNNMAYNFKNPLCPSCQKDKFEKTYGDILILTCEYGCIYTCSVEQYTSGKCQGFCIKHKRANNRFYSFATTVKKQCKICKGTGKIILLTSKVDCECKEKI